VGAQVNVIDGRVINIEARVINVEARLDNIEGRLDNIEARMDNSEARLINSTASEPEDPLVALTNEAGVTFVGFPNTLFQLMTLNVDEMTAILKHYGLAVGGCNEMKRNRIKRFIGMRIA
jgi:hypothetical protein